MKNNKKLNNKTVLKNKSIFSFKELIWQIILIVMETMIFFVTLQIWIYNIQSIRWFIYLQLNISTKQILGDAHRGIFIQCLLQSKHSRRQLCMPSPHKNHVKQLYFYSQLVGGKKVGLRKVKVTQIAAVRGLKMIITHIWVANSQAWFLVKSGQRRWEKESLSYQACFTLLEKNGRQLHLMKLD